MCVCFCAWPPCTPPLLAGVCGVGVCVWAGVSAAPRHSWQGCWGVCVLVCVLLLYPASPGWGVQLGCVCLSSGFGCAPPLPAWVLGCVCARVRAPLAPCHSWLGCAVWACVFGLGFRLRTATPGWAVRCGCVCSGSGFGCAPPLLAGVCGVWVGCCLRPVRVPWLWQAACLSGVPGGPAWCSGGAPVSLPVAVVPFPTLGACAPGFTGRLHMARGGRLRTGLFVPAAGPRRGGGAGLAPRSTRSGPREGGCPWRVPPALVLGCVRCGGWRVLTRSLTRPVSRTVRRSTGNSAGAPGLFRMDPLQVGGRHARVPCVCACACSSWPGRAG